MNIRTTLLKPLTLPNDAVLKKSSGNNADDYLYGILRRQ